MGYCDLTWWFDSVLYLSHYFIARFVLLHSTKNTIICSPPHHSPSRSSRIISRTPVSWSRIQCPPILSILETLLSSEECKSKNQLRQLMRNNYLMRNVNDLIRTRLKSLSWDYLKWLNPITLKWVPYLYYYRRAVLKIWQMSSRAVAIRQLSRRRFFCAYMLPIRDLWQPVFAFYCPLFFTLTKNVAFRHRRNVYAARLIDLRNR